MNNRNTSPKPDPIRCEAKRRCYLCLGSGFAILGYQSVGILYLVAYILTIVTCGVAVMTFTHSAALIAGIMLLVVLLMFVIEITAVSKVKVHEVHINHLRSAFIPLSIVQIVLPLVVVGMLFGTSRNFRMQGTGMSPTLQPGERLICRKSIESNDLVAGRLIVFRLNPENTWIKKRVAIIARILAIPGDKIAQRDGHYIVNGQPVKQVVGFVGQYTRAIAIPEEPNFITVPNGCYFITQDNTEKAFDSQVLAWARCDDIISTDIRHIVKNGEILKKAM